MVKNVALCYNLRKKKRNIVMGFKEENEITVKHDMVTEERILEALKEIEE